MILLAVFVVTLVAFAMLGKSKEWSDTISLGGGFLVACIVTIGAAVIGGPSASPRPIANTAAAPVAISDAACKADLQCWGDRHSIPAGVRCTNPVERLALNSHKWTDGFFESKFPRFGWKDKAAGTLTYAGDSIQFQNGFGAMVNHRYECDYDPASEQVIAVRAAPGRMR